MKEKFIKWFKGEPKNPNGCKNCALDSPKVNRFVDEPCKSCFHQSNWKPIPK